MNHSVRYLLGAIVLLSSGTPCSSLQAENVMRMGSAEAEAGARDVAVIVTATNDIPVHAYSISLAFPGEALRIQALSLAGTHVGLLEPEFVSATFDGRLGVGRMGVILDFDSPLAPLELSATPPESPGQVIARILFEVRSSATSGVYPLTLADGVGSPPGFNRFTVAGQSIVPQLEDGEFFVRGGNALHIERRQAVPGSPDSIKVFAYAQHPEPLDGFQIAFTYDKAKLTIDPIYTDPDPDIDLLFQALFGETSLLEELQPAMIEGWSVDVDRNFSATHARVATVVLFDFLDPTFDGQALSPSTDSPPSQSIAKYTFSVSADAASEGQYQPLPLSDVEFAFAIDNRFIVDDAPVDPRLVDGAIYFSTGTLEGRIVDSDTGEALEGARVSTVPEGFEAVSDATGRFRLVDLPAGPYVLVTSREGYYTGRSETLEVSGEDRVDDAGSLPLFPVADTPLPAFIRGDCDGDGVVAGVINDAVFVLGFNFLGGRPPACLAACDADSDGRVLGTVTDAIYLLNFNFLGNSAPAAPFPSCGSGDEVSAELGCDVASAGCR